MSPDRRFFSPMDTPKKSSRFHRALRFICPPPGSFTVGDRFLVRWLGLSFIVLTLATAAEFSGFAEALELEQIRFLGGTPFYIGAEEAQISLLGPAGTFGLCIAVTLWLAAVLLRERRFAGRAQIMLPALVALALPGMLCVLWGGVLNMALPLLCVLLCWLGAEMRPLARALRHLLFSPKFKEDDE